MFDVYHGKGGIPFIDIFDCQATIARERKEGGYISTERCTNGDELQDDILAAIEAQGAYINMSGRVGCPEELAVLAVWE